MQEKEYYDTFYSSMSTSLAYSQFCEMVYGANLSQVNFSSLSDINIIFEFLNVAASCNILDIGCGNGKLLRYLHEKCGLLGSGIDISEIAIKQAQLINTDKYGVLDFQVGNIDDLDYPDRSFDNIISIDTLYFSNNINDLMQKLLRWLKPNGIFVTFYSEVAFGEKSVLQEVSSLYKWLQANSIRYRLYDFTRHFYEIMILRRKVVRKLKKDFQKEGNILLYNSIYRESIDESESYEVFTKSCNRFLYIIYNT